MAKGKKPKRCARVPPLLHDAINVNGVMEILAVSRATVWRLCEDPTFPKRFKVGKLHTYWRRTEIEGWLVNQMQKRYD